jgi:hypothetical protein
VLTVHGRHRPRYAHDVPASERAEPTLITAQGADFHAAREALRAQVPDDHQLLGIIIGDPAPTPAPGPGSEG